MSVGIGEHIKHVGCMSHKLNAPTNSMQYLESFLANLTRALTALSNRHVRMTYVSYSMIISC
jgi:hypothetical protein